MTPRNSGSSSSDSGPHRSKLPFGLTRWPTAVAALVVIVGAAVGFVLSRSSASSREAASPREAPSDAQSAAIGNELFDRAAARCRLTPASGQRHAAQQQSLLLGVQAYLSQYVGKAQCEEARLAQTTGVKALREDIAWAQTEPRPNHYSWATDDSIVTTAAEAGLTVLPVLDAAPTWAAPTFNSLPSNPAAYAAFVAATVERYGPGGSFWRSNPRLPARPLVWYELWNEPYDADHNRDPGVYAHLVRAAVTAGRTANPAARFLIEASTHYLTPRGRRADWIAGLYAALPDLGSYFDGIAIHPYGGDPSNVTRGGDTDNEPAAQVEQAHSDLVAHGDGNKPIWVTEIGWSTCLGVEDCVTEPQQARYLRSFLASARATWRSYVRAVFVFALRDAPLKPRDDMEAWFGLLRPDLSHKPVWQVLADVAMQTA